MDGVGFVVKLVTNKDTGDPKQVFDPAGAFIRYEVQGPIGQQPKYLWMGTAQEQLMADPTADVPPELTAQAHQAFEAWLNWSHETEDGLAGPWQSKGKARLVRSTTRFWGPCDPGPSIL